MKKSIAIVFALVFAFVGAASAQIIDPSRTTTWNPGLKSAGGIPNRTTLCTTLPVGVTLPLIPSGGDDTALIQSVLDSCTTAEQVVTLGAGTFRVSNFLLVHSSVTVRGAGPTQTTILKTNGATTVLHDPPQPTSPIFIVGPAQFANFDTTSAVNLTGTDATNGTKGSTSVTVSSAAGYAAGQIVLLDELSGAGWQNDLQVPAWNPGSKVWASPDYLIQWPCHMPQVDARDDCGGSDVNGPFDCTDYPICAPANQVRPAGFLSWFSRLDRPKSEWKEIQSVAGNTITFTSPLHSNYRPSHTAQLIRPDAQSIHVKRAGIESLKLVGSSAGGIIFGNAAYSWAKAVDLGQWAGGGIILSQSFRTEIRGSYVHDSMQPYPGGGGYAIFMQNGDSEALIEDNIVVLANKVVVADAAGAGAVVGYNYMDDSYIAYNGNFQEAGLNASHMVGSHHVLFEGNYGSNWESDDTHGNAVAHTVFRNHLRGLRKAYSDPLAPDGNWAPSTSYAVDRRVWNGSTEGPPIGYWAVVAGTSAAIGPGPCGPNPASCVRSDPTCTTTSTATCIVDGTVKWMSMVVGTPATGTFQTFDDAGQFSTAFNGPYRTVGAQAYAYNHNFVGNVLGLSGQMTGWTYNVTGQAGWNSPAIWLLGWESTQPNPYDSSVEPTIQRDGNWDWVNAAQKWCGIGVTTCTGTPQVIPNSLYYTGTPPFWPATGYTYPWVDPSTGTTYRLPAKARFDAGTPFVQPP